MYGKCCIQCNMAAESSSYRASPTRRLSNAASGKSTGGFCLPSSAVVMYHSKPHGCDSLHSMHHMLAKAYQITCIRHIWQQLWTHGWSYMRNGMTMSGCTVSCFTCFSSGPMHRSVLTLQVHAAAISLESNTHHRRHQTPKQP